MWLADEILKFARRFSTQVTILTVICIPVYINIEARWERIYSHEKDLSEKEVALKKKELELTTKTRSNEAFYAALKEFHSISGSVDLSREIQCDEAYMNRYKEAEGRLAALEGMARETGKYSSYENFFNKNHMHLVINKCEKKD